MDQISCILCTSENCTKATYLEKDKITKEPVQYYTCPSCNVEFVFPQGLENLEEIYEEGIGEKFGIKQKIMFRIPVSFRHKEVFTFLDHLPRGSLVDIGCREGKLSWLLQKDGWEVTGIEPTTFFANHAKKVYSLPVINSFMQDVQEKKKFDVVLLSAVLEHVRDQVGFLKEAKEFMKDTGQIFIRIPHDKSKWHAATHLFIHSAKSINYVIDQAGLYVTKMDVVGREFFILAKKK